MFAFCIGCSYLMCLFAVIIRNFGILLFGNDRKECISIENLY